MKHLKIFFILLLIGGCVKKPVHINYDFNESEFTISNVTQYSIKIAFKVNNEGLKLTEILYSNDSALLIMNSSDLKRLDPIFNKESLTYNCELTQLEPYTKYWFQIYFKDIYDSITYSSIYSATTLGFNLRDLTPKKTVRGWNMNFIGDNVDTVKLNYNINIDSKLCALENIIKNNDGTYQFSVKVPDSASYGMSKFIVRYLNRTVFNDDIEVYRGVLQLISSHPTLGGFSNSFGYKGWIYVYYFPDAYSKFWKYNPLTNEWIQLSTPNITPRLPEYSQGYEINGKIYFPPFTCTELISVFCSRNQEDEKFIYSYDPEMNLWERHELLTNDSVPIYSGLFSSFVFENKLFCFVIHNNADDHTKILLKMFDPADYSWKTVVDSVPFPIPDTQGCVSCVINNNIYVMPAIIREYYMASQHYRNELYLFDLQSKTFTKKSMWDDAMSIGSKNAYLFEYNGHLYYYGGEYSTGYLHRFWLNSYEYSPETDTWAPLGTCFVFFGDYVVYGGFLQDINDRIFIGFGWSNYIYEFILK